MPARNCLVAIFVICALCACTATPEIAEESDPDRDLGLLWVKNAVEYQAVSMQIYAQATADLPRFINDTSWSAMPGHNGASDLPPAVILDVDETVVSNIEFQMNYIRPFSNAQMEDWNARHGSLAVNGVVEFVAAARKSGVAVFFVTNRPCELQDGIADPCPQKMTTVNDIRDIGIHVDPEFVMLSGERPEWNREKLSRRQHVAKTHRVIMLIGDDFGDFVPCARRKVVAPCKVSATAASRAAALEKFRDYWGRGWYILPNPMHGSWTSAH